jgi:hypothetical protein
MLNQETHKAQHDKKLLLIESCFTDVFNVANIREFITPDQRKHVNWQQLRDFQGKTVKYLTDYNQIELIKTLMIRFLCGDFSETKEKVHLPRWLQTYIKDDQE